MAAIFQIRRGTSNITISDGELYLHKGSGSIQFGSGSTPYNLLPLNAPANGDIILTGNITASNAYFSGDVAISGNLFLGNASNDTITAGGEFTSNLIPNPTNTYTLGSSTKIWKEVHATSISGAIAATNGVISGSSQIASSLPTGIVSGSSQINFTQIGGISNDIVSASTDSTNIDFTITNGNISANLKGGVVSGSSQIDFTGLSGISANIVSASSDTSNVDIIITGGSISANLKGGVISGSSQITSVLDSLNEFSSSIHTATASLNLTTASLNEFTQSASNRLSRLEESSQSLNDYSQSLKTAISLDTTNVTILGNLTVNGTTTQINSTQVNIGENILELNYGGSATEAGIYVKDASVGGSNVSGSILWDATTDYWKAGIKGTESKILLAGGDGVISGSSQINFTQLSGISANIVSASSDTSNVDMIITDGSISANLKGGVVSGSSQITYVDISSIPAEIVSGSSQLTSSLDLRYLVTGSVTSSINQLNSATASLYDFTSSTNIRLNNLESTSASVSTSIDNINTFTASVNEYILDINSFTASVTASIIELFGTASNHEGRIDDLETKATTLGTYTASVENRFQTISNVTASLNLHTESLNLYTSSTDLRLDDLEYIVTILDPDNIGDALLGINVFTASTNNRLNNLEATTSSLNSFSSSINDTIKTKLNIETVVSGSSQVSYIGLSNIPAGIISSSAQIDTLFNIDGLVSGSSQINFTELSGISTNIISASTDSANIDFTITGGSITADLKGGVVSGSSQISYIGLSNIPAGIISSSAQIDTLFNIDGLVSGSSQINFTQLSGISTNIISSSSDTSNVDVIITGGSISANLYGGVVSGSAQIVNVLTSLNSFSASNDNTSLNSATSSYETKGRGIVSGSSQVNFTQLSGISSGIVSSSAQITPLLPSGILSGSNQTNITSINQNLGTSTTGVQFASLGIGTAPDATYELKIQGDIAASGDIVAYYTSDKRLKDNIQPIENALDKVNELGGYTFDWNEELQKARKGHDIGVIAQEVQSVLPEVVVERDNGYLGVDYQKLVPVLIEAIKELSAKVKELENK
jgi:hypothetical protein